MAANESHSQLAYLTPVAQRKYIMRTNKLFIGSAIGVAMISASAFAADIYGPYPVTLKGYSGDKTNSVSYSG